jgi:hypothetical protein
LINVLPSRIAFKRRALAITIPFSTTLTKFALKHRTIAAIIPKSITLSRMAIKARFIATTIPFSTTLTGGRLTVMPTIAAVITLSVTVARQALKGRSIATTIPILTTQTMQRTKARIIATTIPFSTTLNLARFREITIAITLTTSQTLNRVVSKSRIIAAIIPTSTTLNRLKTSIRAIATSIPISTTLILAKTGAMVINATMPISTTLNMVRHKFRTIGITIPINVNPAIAARAGWILSGQYTDFPDKLDNLVKAYIASKWSATVTPQIGASLTTDEAQQDNFEYDSFRTYYIKITEGQSKVINRQTRQRLYEFETPIMLECTVRKLSKGESFPHLNDMINELLRIFGEFQKEDIFGIQGITLDSITPIGNDSANKSVWQKTLRVTLHYWKVDNSH